MTWAGKDIKMNIEAKVRQIMSRILEVNESEIMEDSAIGDFPSWDSLHHLEMIAEIENNFGIHFTPDVLIDLEDFSDIVKAVEERVAQ